MSNAETPYTELLSKPDALVGLLVQKDEIITGYEREIHKLQAHLIKLQKGIIQISSSQRPRGKCANDN